jgi:putative nucleotidyltransferase with HDIG domain
LKSCGKVVENEIESPDLVLTLGGDGTILKAIRMIKDKKTLIYGINYGKTGFLTNSSENIEEKIKGLLNGKFKVSERMLLELSVEREGKNIYDVFKHSVFACQAAADCHFSLEVRLAALFHDIAKPDVKKGEGPDATFYNHDIVGAKETEKILKRLRFPKKTIEKVVRLVKNHMFNSDPQRLTEHGARRLWRRIADGREINDEVRKEMRDLINLRIADRMGMEKKPRPFRLRAIEALLEKVSRDPISEKMLKVNGYDVMEILKIGPGIKVGAILKILLAEVLEDPKKNEENYLRKRIEELGELSDESLIELKKSAQLRIEKEIEKEEEEIRKKYF